MRRCAALTGQTGLRVQAGPDRPSVCAAHFLFTVGIL